MKKRWVSLLLACIMIVAAIPAFNVYADEEVYYFVNQNYESLLCIHGNAPGHGVTGGAAPPINFQLIFA